MWTPCSPYAARRYRAVATGGATSDTRNGARSGPGASRRDRTKGQTHITAGPRSLDASRRTASVATNSSPQLAGTATVNPRRRHACANCTGVAGAASSTTSLPMIATIDTGLRSAIVSGADMMRKKLLFKASAEHASCPDGTDIADVQQLSDACELRS